MLKFSLSKVFFYILLVFLPFQTSKVFFTDKSFYFGFHAFYNTIFIYLTDFLIFGLILAWLWENWTPALSKVEGFSRENNPSPTLPSSGEGVLSRIIKKISNDPIHLFTLSFWLILAISLIFSRENLLGLYGLARISGYLLIFAYIRENLSPLNLLRLRRKKKEGVVSREIMAVFWLILGTACFQSLLAIYQYLSQSSVGLIILGEEFLSPGLKGIAKFATHGIANPLLYDFFPYLSAIPDTPIVMRGYGTFPHPNVLAGFLFLGLMVNIYLLYFSTPSSSPPYQGGERRGGFRVKIVFLMISLVILCTGLVVTFSRLTWGISFLAILAIMTIILLKYRPRRFNLPANHFYFPGRIGLVVAVLLVSAGLNLFLFGTQIQDRVTSQEIANPEASENFIDRKTYGNAAWHMVKANPIFGVGARNFVAEMDDYSKERLLPHQHQPVHNIYLLLLAEAGIFALISFLLLIYNIVRRALAKKKSPVGEMLLIIFFGFLVLGFFDHYFFTIQQGSLMFWVVAGMLAAK